MKSSLLTALIFCWGQFPVLAQPVVNISLTQLGARANDGKDDTPAFLALLKMMQTREGTFNVILPAGTLDFRDQLYFTKIKSNLNLIGNSRGTVIKVNGSGSLLIEPVIVELKMIAQADRKSNSIRVQSIPGREVNPGDLLHIQSNTVFETGWNYKENDVMRISRISGNTIYFDDPLIFNYQPGQETVTVKVYKKIAVSLSNIHFLISPVKDSLRATAMVIRGVSVNVMNANFRYAGKMDNYHNGLALAACENVEMNNIRMYNLMYGVPMNFCRNVKAYNSIAEDTRHAYVPATASINVFVKGLKGKRCHSVMDSHVSINVHYEDVFDTLAVYPPDCRALGVKVINARFSMAKPTYQLYTYWSVQGLTKEYIPMYAEYDNYFKNVQWISNAPGKLNGITSFSCRKLILENCTTHSVGYYGDHNTIQQILIRNCRIGAVYSDANRVIIENTIMDGKLFPVTDFVFRFASSGTSSIKGVKVINYDPDITYLFSGFHNQPTANGLVITNSTVGNLRGWTDKPKLPGINYTTLKIEKSSFGRFREDVQPEFSNPQPILKRKQ